MDSKKTAFITTYGLFEFTRMEFGLCNAPATFTLAINMVLNRLNWKIALAFMDNVLDFGTSAETHLDNLHQVLERFRQYGLNLSTGNVNFSAKSRNPWSLNWCLNER